MDKVWIYRVNPKNRRRPEIGSFVTVNDGMNLILGQIASYVGDRVQIRTRHDRVPPFWTKVETLVPRGLTRLDRGKTDMFDISLESAI